MAVPERPAFVLDVFARNAKTYWIVPSIHDHKSCNDCVVVGNTMRDHGMCAHAPCSKDQACRHDKKINSIVIDPDRVDEYLLARVNQKLHT